MTAARAKPVQAPSRPWSRIIGTRSQFTTWSGNGPRCGRYGQSRMSMRSGIASSRRPWTRSAGWEVSARRRLGEGTRVVLGVEFASVRRGAPVAAAARCAGHPPSFLVAGTLGGSGDHPKGRLGRKPQLSPGARGPRACSGSARGHRDSAVRVDRPPERAWQAVAQGLATLLRAARCRTARARPPCQCAIAGLAGSATSSLESVRSRITVMAPISAQPPSTSSPDVKSPVASFR